MIALVYVAVCKGLLIRVVAAMVEDINADLMLVI